MITHKIREFTAKQIMRGRVGAYADAVEETLRTGVSQIDDRHLEGLMTHTVQKVPFYRNFVNYSFDEFPVINKAMIRSDLSAFFSCDAKRSKLSSASTSGSTGIPFTAYFDQEKVLRHRAGLVGSYRFMEADPFGPFVFSRAWSNIGIKQRLTLGIKGHLPYAGVHQDSMPVTSVVNWIHARDRVTLMGYSSYIEGLLRDIERTNLTVKPGAVDAVIGGSEPASAYLESAARNLLGLKLRMRYSNMELGIIAVTGLDPDIYHIDTQSYYVEILKEDSNEPATPGQPGRIVVTDLHNRAMPFLRYDTGDMGEFYIDPDGIAHTNRLVNIKGRRLDVLLGGTDSEPKKMHPMQIWGPTSRITELRQFQLRQHDLGRFTWILNAERSRGLEARLEKILRDVVGTVFECNFTYVAEVPVMASGKRQFFVNEII